MERAVAIKKVAAILGRDMGYRVDASAPSSDVREAAREALKAANAERDRLRADRDARKAALLAADAEYQALVLAADAAGENCKKLMSLLGHYKITVGISNSMFFHVRAQGDTWEQVIAKLGRGANAV
jgi:regulator of protease activity HflC (stomatin/prohibitin superfamily)